MNRVTLILIVATMLLSTCNGQTNNAQNVEILDTIWETINTQYFDSTFNGLNWEAEYEYYKPIIKSCESNDSLFYYLNQMLFKLNVSHLFALPPNSEDEIGSPQLFLDGTAGIDLRLINEEAIIISVRINSAAFNIGIKPGFRLIEVNGKTVKSIIDKRKSEPIPPFNDINIRLLSTENIIRELYGTPGDTVNITYMDENNLEHNVSFQLKNRGIEKLSFIPSLPPMYASIDKRIISDIKPIFILMFSYLFYLTLL